MLTLCFMARKIVMNVFSHWSHSKGHCLSSVGQSFWLYICSLEELVDIFLRLKHLERVKCSRPLKICYMPPLLLGPWANCRKILINVITKKMLTAKTGIYWVWNTHKYCSIYFRNISENCNLLICSSIPLRIKLHLVFLSYIRNVLYYAKSKLVLRVTTASDW